MSLLAQVIGQLLKEKLGLGVTGRPKWQDECALMQQKDMIIANLI